MLKCFIELDEDDGGSTNGPETHRQCDLRIRRRIVQRADAVFGHRRFNCSNGTCDFGKGLSTHTMDRYLLTHPRSPLKLFIILLNGMLESFTEIQTLSSSTLTGHKKRQLSKPATKWSISSLESIRIP